MLEYIDGTPVTGPMSPETAGRAALQIARALEAAHARGMLHRDLKPGNILITRAGDAKLLDFGLVKLLRGSDVAEDVTRTIGGAIVGTAAYMSPEQAEGRAVDARSDVFSFGAVLYEMLSGTRAFAGETTAQVLSAVLRDTPRSLAASPLARIATRCLEKDPARCYQAMAEVRAALEDVVRGHPDRDASVAVLPFADMSPARDNEYFSDGLAEEIINTLAQVSELKVIARTSAFAFKGQNVDIRRIAETLGVTHVLEGSVRKAAERAYALMPKDKMNVGLLAGLLSREGDSTRAEALLAELRNADAYSVPMGLFMYHLARLEEDHAARAGDRAA